MVFLNASHASHKQRVFFHQNYQTIVPWGLDLCMGPAMPACYPSFWGDPTVSSDSKSTTTGVKGGGGISVYYFVNINICMKLAKM